MANRRDELPRTWFRSNRVFRSDGEWFIHTREGIAVGPYTDKFAADVDAEVLKSLLIDADAAEANDVINEFMVNGGRNIRQHTETAIEIDASEVASLLEDEVLEFGFDQIRQLS